MTVYFSNKGRLDLDVIRTMGVSVKDGDTPIGYFGTGLKYAIATLIRTGHEVTLQNGSEELVFGSVTKEIRNKPFQIITMNDEQLGFTVDLGKDWHVWQAYRELASNAMDEGGKITNSYVENDVVFTVVGPEIDEAHDNRSQIFLHSEPTALADGIEIHPGASSYLYYRGIRVYKLPKPTAFTYNFVTDMRLTEDRTLASIWDANYKLATRLPRCESEKVADKVCNPNEDHYELGLDFSDCWDPSDEFVQSLVKHRSNARLPENFRKMLDSKAPDMNDYEFMFLTAEQEADVAEACAMLRQLNAIVQPSELHYVEHLGPGIYAAVRNGKMLITRQCIANGVDFLAITIYEEWIHDKMGYQDESRGMQQFLFDKILELLKRES